MEIRQFAWDIVDSNSWLLTEGDSGLLIDAVENDALFQAINSIDELTIILTHCHFDHIIGLNRIRSVHPKTTVIATSLCSEFIGSAVKNTSNMADAFLEFYLGGAKKDTGIKPFICNPADRIFEDEMTFDWQGHKVNLKAVHGHTSDSLVGIVDGRYLFSGDTLLSIPTVTRLRTGSTRRFFKEDIPVLESLNVETVFPGHGVSGNKEIMIETNLTKINLDSEL